ncbi:MAG: MFS transporter [Desulfuromonadales bacterium]|nr:MFS transporter [Desulfuromonadales bacterium]
MKGTLNGVAQKVLAQRYGYFSFLQGHSQILVFGLLLTFFSSFGQTFLISIFVPQFLEVFALDTAQFGTLYAVATLTSAASLPWFGRLLDRVALHRFSLTAGLGLALACLTMALAPNVGFLFIALLGLRLTGQGLLSLTASITMARVFEKGRGRALSLSGLGYPLGEGLLPLGVVLLAQGVGWRLSWGLLGGVVALVLLPAISLLLHHERQSSDVSVVKASSLPGRFALLRDGRFYALLPSTIFLPLVLTALFLYQIPLAEAYGWSVKTIATAFIGFASARMAGSLLIGPWIDRCGAQNLFPLTLLPACAGLIVLSLGSAPWIALVYLSLVGISQGINGPTMTALWAEVYGVESLGATKGIVATIGVFATALGPVVVGGLLKVGVPFTVIVPGCAVLGLVAVVTGLLVRSRFGEVSTAAPV